ncbi:MAG: hypothetical protein U9Q82_08475, partial [Chloroflexota bacterium]|nr:hypothetical protein [Chloroflexota bacterium]
MSINLHFAPLAGDIALRCHRGNDAPRQLGDAERYRWMFPRGAYEREKVLFSRETALHYISCLTTNIF